MECPQFAEFAAATNTLTGLQTMDISNIYDKTKTFPEKLMDILTQEEEAGNDTIAWLPDGKSFIISNPLKFTLEILPQHFKQTEFSSFTRKLYWWGFKKSSKGHECDSFQHELFSRDDPYLCMNMKGRSNRTRKSKKAMKAKANKMIPSKDKSSSLPMSLPGIDSGCASSENVLNITSPMASNDALHHSMPPFLPPAATALDPMARLQLMQSVLAQSGPPFSTAALPLSRYPPVMSQPYADRGMLPTHQRPYEKVCPKDNTTQSPIVLHVHHHHVGGNTFTSVSFSPSSPQTK